MVKIVILTNGEYFTNIIQKLNRVHNITVLTHKKKPQGRGLKIHPNPITLFCNKNNIQVYEIENINEELTRLMACEPDILLLCDFKDILKENILSIPKRISLNIHPSLLPKFRGASPIQSVLLSKEIFTGYSIIEITSRIDAGKIYYQEMIPIFEWDNFFTLRKRIFEKIEDCIVDIIEKIIKGELTGIPQDEKQVILCKKFRREDGLIGWDDRADNIYRKLCAFKKWPGIFFYDSSKRKIEIINAYIVDYDSSVPPGTILSISPFGVHVQTGEKVLNIIKIKPEGKKIMSGFDYINGRRLKKGDKIS
ncbi:MAG: methionyl-tRNA formyltransferase [Planctomycetota bacterium]